jgi:hypothetical protein
MVETDTGCARGFVERHRQGSNAGLSERCTFARTTDVHSGGSVLETARHHRASGNPELFFLYSSAYTSGLPRRCFRPGKALLRDSNPRYRVRGGPRAHPEPLLTSALHRAGGSETVRSPTAVAPARLAGRSHRPSSRVAGRATRRGRLRELGAAQLRGHGIYLFSERGTPMYVGHTGRTERSIAKGQLGSQRCVAPRQDLRSRARRLCTCSPRAGVRPSGRGSLQPCSRRACGRRLRSS